MYHQKVCSQLSLTKSGVTEQVRFKDYWAHALTRTEIKISMINMKHFFGYIDLSMRYKRDIHMKYNVPWHSYQKR